MDQNYNNYPPTQPKQPKWQNNEEPQQPQWQAPAEPQQPQWQAAQPQQPQWQAAQPQQPQWQAPAESQQPQWQAQNDQQWQDQNQPTEYPINPQPPKKKKGSALMWLLIAIGVLTLAAVGAALYFFLWRTPDTPTPRTDFDEEEEYIDESSDLDDDSAYDLSAEEEEGADDDAAIEEPTEEEMEPQPISEAVAPQLNLTGDADGYPLSLQLNIGNDGRVTGEYNDLQNNRTVNVSGTKSGDVITLQGRGGGRTYNFRIVPTGRIYTGTLRTSSGQEKELHLTVQ